MTFVPGLEGLGKVPFSNVRTPKQLLQIPTGPEEENDESGDDENEPRVRLANEPLLAARIMIERSDGNVFSDNAPKHQRE